MDTLLVIAPHPDDEILGVGGTIAKYSDAGWTVVVLTVAGHLPPLYDEGHYQTTLREAAIAHDIVGVEKSVNLDIPATFLHTLPVHELNGKIYDVIEDLKPRLVFCPFPDRHIDHRTVFDSAMVACRPLKAGSSIERLVAYETLSETHWNAASIEPLFQGSWVVDISTTIDRKLRAAEAFSSQIPAFPGARSIEALKALAIFRGTQAGFAYGEAFQVIRMLS